MPFSDSISFLFHFSVKAGLLHRPVSAPVPKNRNSKHLWSDKPNLNSLKRGYVRELLTKSEKQGPLLMFEENVERFLSLQFSIDTLMTKNSAIRKKMYPLQIAW